MSRAPTSAGFEVGRTSAVKTPSYPPATVADVEAEEEVEAEEGQ